MGGDLAAHDYEGTGGSFLWVADRVEHTREDTYAKVIEAIVTEVRDALVQSGDLETLRPRSAKP